MIMFTDWVLTSSGVPIAMQYDNRSRNLVIHGTLPDGWSWSMLVRSGPHFNILDLYPIADGIGTELTADMLSLSGYYTMQLRGTKGDVVRHTNVINTYIPESLSGDAAWPEVPSAFSQIEERLNEINNNPPKPGQDGYWTIYDPDDKEYKPSTIPLPVSGGGIYSSEITAIKVLDLEEYENLDVKNPKTLYCIRG